MFHEWSFKYEQKNWVMKKLLCFLVLVLMSANVRPQVLVVKTRQATNNNRDSLHKVANDFSREVGLKLKELYPAKVSNISVKLESQNGVLSLTYKAQISRCSQEEAKYYFDHRGSLSMSHDQLSAVIDARKRTDNQKYEVLAEFMNNYRDVLVISQNSDQTQHLGNYWVINEIFVASKK